MQIKKPRLTRYDERLWKFIQKTQFNFVPTCDFFSKSNSFIISDVPSSDPGDEELEVPEPTKDENGKGRISFRDIFLNCLPIQCLWSAFTMHQLLLNRII